MALSGSLGLCVAAVSDAVSLADRALQQADRGHPQRRDAARSILRQRARSLPTWIASARRAWAMSQADRRGARQHDHAHAARTMRSCAGCGNRCMSASSPIASRLERMVIAAPSPMAVEAERALTLLQQRAGSLRRLGSIAASASGSAPRASALRATGISPGSGASARIMIRPVVVGDSTISRSAAVTSSSSGKLAALRAGHQIELDDAPAGGAVVDGVIGDAAPGVERHRRVGRADRHA